MGSKRKLTNQILSIVRNNLKLNNDKYILDLFAGTNTVSELFKSITPVITNDIQEYSYQIALATIKNKSTTIDKKMIEDLNNEVSNHIKIQQNIFGKYLNKESNALANRDFNSYLKFSSSFPSYGYNRNDHELSDYFSQNNIEKYRNNKDYLLFTTYFSNSYFSLNQSIHIDSIRYAIDKVPNKVETQNRKTVKSILLTCLLSSLSMVVNSTSHFAQYHKLSQKKFNWILERRQKNVLQIFFSKIHEFNLEFVPTSFENICLRKNYRNILSDNQDLLEKTQLVYIDPPYSCAPYSRFYHVLETAVKYDYPDAQHDGKYRSDRHISGFNKKGQVRNEFKYLLDNLAEYGCSVLFSYPGFNDLNFNAEHLIEMCKDYYNQIVIEKIQHKRQGFGNKKARNSQIEYLILCKK